MLIRLCLLFTALKQVAVTELGDGLPPWNTTDQGSITDHVIEIMEHFKQPDPVGIPGAPIPDPMPIPDLRHAKTTWTLVMKNATVRGLSQFKIDEIYSDMAEMQIELALKYAKLEVIGNYTLTNWFSRSAGGFNVTIVGVYLEGVGVMEVTRNGNLQASDINMDISFDNIRLDFKNLGLLGSIFQGMINTLGTFVFDSIKPFILSTVNTNIRGDINKFLKNVKKTFPNSIPPLDLAIAELRKATREKGYDPYKLEDYTYSAGIFSFDARQIWLFGLATFYRVGNITIGVTNNTVTLGLQVATKRIKGKTDWEVSLGGVLSRTGYTSFSVEYLEVDAKVNQSLNVRKTPKLEDLKVSVGNIQLRSDGLGTVDYLMELVANVLPNLLRYQIVDAMEGLLRQRLQENLNLIDIEREIRSHMKELEGITDPDADGNTVFYEDEDFPEDTEIFDDIAA
uniref:Mite allergen Lep d 7 n=1 Tax=Lygus hesperus TaxID=30085 RepID=A0A0A9Z8L6_LYGHE